MLQGGVTRRPLYDSLEKQLSHQEECMALSAHLESLKKKHREMSEAVEEAQRSPGVDDLQVSSMKKEKLRLKEEIARLTS